MANDYVYASEAPGEGKANDVTRGDTAPPKFLTGYVWVETPSGTVPLLLLRTADGWTQEINKAQVVKEAMAYT